MDKKSNSLNISLDLRLVCIVLILVIGGMLAIWRPWETAGAQQRKITISGTSTIKAEPDEYRFNPHYERKTTAETSELSKKVTEKLKELGVNESQIKVDANRFKTYSPVNPGEETTTLSMTILVNNKELAQKVQDYLITTNPSGSVTPYMAFSKDKQNELEDRARNEAIADARKKAENTASGFGSKVNKVIEVSETPDSGITPWLESGAVARDSASVSSMPLQPGENEFTYSISVIFSLK